MRSKFGKRFRLRDSSPERKFIEAFGAAPLSEVDLSILEATRQAMPHGATGQNLDEVLFIFERRPAERAVGIVEMNLKSIPAAPSPLFAEGTITFIDSARDRYDLIADIVPPSAPFDSTQSGVDSETINDTRTRIAQKFSLAARTFVQGFAIRVDHGGVAPVFDVKIETDAAGDPSGALAHADLSIVGFAPGDDVKVKQVFTEGAYLDAGDYWITFTRTAGEGAFDGNTGGTANQVKTFVAAWANSGTVENLNCAIYTGGLASLRAQKAGSQGNLAPNEIVDVEFPGGLTVHDDWAALVDTFTNLDDFTAGRDEADDVDFLTEAENRKAAKPESAPAGVEQAILRVEGVESTTVIDNKTLIGGTEDTLFSDTTTGTASELIDAVNTRIARKIVTTRRSFTQHVKMKLHADTTGIVGTVRIETNAAGVPSGILANAVFEKASVTPGGTAIFTVTFANGDYLEAGTYWVVFQRTAGSATFAGGVGGAAGDVKVFDGAWTDDATINQMYAEVFGGIPGKNFRAWVDGGDVDEIAQAILDSAPISVLGDGTTTGTAKDLGQQDVTVRFERPTIVPVFIEITVSTDASFVSTANDIRDKIVRYIGGTDTKGNSHPGLPVRRLGGAGDVLVDQIKSAVLGLTGALSVTVLKVDDVDPPVATTDLGIANGSKAKIQSAANDIDVTIA